MRKYILLRWITGLVMAGLLLQLAFSPAPVVAGDVRPALLALSQPQSNGFALAIAILVGMIAALVYTAVTWARAWRSDAFQVAPPPTWLDTLIPALSIIGLGVAGYLTYVETQAVPAVCGPVGDCNAVQASSYSKLFGVLPVGVLGMAGYVAIVVAWLWGRFRSDRLADYAPLAIQAMTVFGVLFSVYLTYLELFVIRAVCAWCLTSAVIITLLMLLAMPLALASLGSEAAESEFAA
jgi:uncharacterized membrane protein